MIGKLVGKGMQALGGALFVVAAAVAGFVVGAYGWPALLGVLAASGVPGTLQLIQFAPVVGLISALGFASKAGGD